MGVCNRVGVTVTDKLFASCEDELERLNVQVRRKVRDIVTSLDEVTVDGTVSDALVSVSVAVELLFALRVSLGSCDNDFTEGDGERDSDLAAEMEGVSVKLRDEDGACVGVCDSEGDGEVVCDTLFAFCDVDSV